ncbi:MAG TPA: DNA primase [Candidatus Kapabacteria bacterium]
MRTSDDIVERVRDATNIVDVVSEHVQLKKRGRNYLGLCPFHNEKTPSFNVLEDKGIFKCFGCGEAGDVYSFVMKLEGLTFPETLEKLAKAANIEYERTQGTKEAADKNEPILNACREFAAYCYRTLRSDAGIAPLKYLTDRGFGEEILKKFGVGYAPQNGFISTLGDTMSAYIGAGIISTSDNGDHYERFRDRIIFPIFNPTGRIIAFGGRILPSHPQAQTLAKYVNSPETSLYHKSNVLYGLFQAKDAIRKADYALLVEGYADVIALHQAGFETAIAASGTSLTVEQLNLLRRYTRNIVLLFDADLAGKNAALRGIELALAAGFDVGTIVLPAGEDPDSFVQKEGKEGFERQLINRTSFIETKAQILAEQGGFASPESSARSIRSIVESIAKIPDAIKQEFFIHRIAEKYRLSQTMLLSEMQKQTGKQKREYVKKEIERDARMQSDPNYDAPPMEVNAPPTRSELIMLRAFLDDTATSYKVVIEVDFDMNLIENLYVSSVIRHCMRKYEDHGENESAGAIIEAYRDDKNIIELVTSVLTNKNRLSTEWEKYSDDIEERVSVTVRHATAMITADVLTKKREELKIQLAISNGDYETILQEIAECSRKITELRALTSRA